MNIERKNLLPTSALQVLSDSEGRPIAPDKLELLEQIARRQSKGKEQASITDWLFENFWGNPYEPKHSKLIGYFINPAESHGCKDLLLKQFLAIVCEKEWSSTGAFRVETEGDGIGRIDLLITHQIEQRYAIIIENKVNGAVDQDNQLENYVEWVKSNRTLGYDRIHVLYMPLDDHKEPAAADLAAIQKKGVHYRKVTFKNHVRDWLDAALKAMGEGASATDAEVRRQMCVNLSHYRDLIDYLNRKEKELTMNNDIIEIIKKNPLSWEDAHRLAESATGLQRGIERILRGTLFEQVRDLLLEKKCQIRLDPSTSGSFDRFDARFEEHQNITLLVELPTYPNCPVLCLGFADSSGFSPTNLWIGYRKGSMDFVDLPKSERVEKELESCIDSLRGSHQPEIWGPGKERWVYCADVKFSDLEDGGAATRLAHKLAEMRDCLQRALP